MREKILKLKLQVDNCFNLFELTKIIKVVSIILEYLF